MESAALRCSFGRPRATSSTEATRTEAGGKLSHKQAYCVDLARWQWPTTASLRHRITLETLSAAATAALAEFRHHPKWPILGPHNRCYFYTQIVSLDWSSWLFYYFSVLFIHTRMQNCERPFFVIFFSDLKKKLSFLLIFSMHSLYSQTSLKITVRN